jgi:hypothetical protein
MMIYTIGVQRRFLPLFRKYRVTSHEFRAEPLPRLILVCEDGSQLAIPGLAQRIIKVYPDYQPPKELALVEDEAQEAVRE